MCPQQKPNGPDLQANLAKLGEHKAASQERKVASQTSRKNGLHNRQLGHNTRKKSCITRKNGLHNRQLGTEANETAAALMTLRKSDGEGKQDDAAAAVVAHNNDDDSTKPGMIFTPSSQASRTTPHGRDGRGGINGFVLFLRYGRYCNDGGTLTLKAYVELLLTAAGKQRNAKSKKAKATTSTAGAGAYKQSFQLWKGLSPEQRNRYNLLACQIKMKRRSSV